MADTTGRIPLWIIGNVTEKIEKHELGINIIKNNIISDECDR